MGPSLLSHVHEYSTIHGIRSIHPSNPSTGSYNSLLLPLPRSLPAIVKFGSGSHARERRGGREGRRSLNNSLLSLSLSLGSDQSCLPPPLSLPRPRLLLPPTRRKSIAEIQVHHTGRAAAAALVGLAVDVGGARRRRHAPARPRSVRPRPPRRRRRDLIQPLARSSSRRGGEDRDGSHPARLARVCAISPSLSKAEDRRGGRMSSSNSPCAACKLLRRKCTQGCVFAPYFPPDQPAKFANVHKVFGASNVSKLLNELPVAQREDAVNSLAYEAEARLRDPVYGCVAYISVLQLKIKQVREEIANARKELSGYIGQAAYAPVVPMQHPHAAAAQYAAMGLVQPHPHQHQHQQMAMQQQQQPYHQQIADAQHMAAVVEVARSGGQGQQHHHHQQHHQHQQHEMMMMRQTYGNVHGAAAEATIAVEPPTQGAAYDGTAPFLIQQQQPSPSALTYRMEEPSPPPQSSGHSHVDMSHAPQQRHQHTDGSDEGSGGAPPA